MVANGWQGGGAEVQLIQVEPGGCSGMNPNPWECGAAMIVVVDGVGRVLTGDVWLEVGPGDRIALEPGAPIAVRAGMTGPVVAVLVGWKVMSTRAA
ncbi:cupin domain-containing protein [Tautonia rosea]|uniref:cupin domain-containing protein n=1 Tax=Tautonia rosea TaxID=2728037 RepID=UPI00147336DF|nr:hypothetical protein [Tautonia rosea]